MVGSELVVLVLVLLLLLVVVVRALMLISDLGFMEKAEVGVAAARHSSATVQMAGVFMSVNC